MRAILGSLSIVVLLAYPVFGGLNYPLPVSHGYSPALSSIYSSPAPEIYSVGDHGLLNAANIYGGGADFGFAGGYASPDLIAFPPPIVTKLFTIHSAPEEPPEVRVRHLALGQPQKTYRVVFIKAPVQQSATRITASFAPKEEKTVIYVLSKKPETDVINEIIQPPPTEPSRPEVVFVKYKTPEEAAHAQQEIQAQYDALGGSTQVSDEGVAPLTSVVGSLGHVEPLIGGIHPTTDNLLHVLSTRSPKIVRALPKRKH